MPSLAKLVVVSGFTITFALNGTVTAEKEEAAPALSLPLSAPGGTASSASDVLRSPGWPGRYRRPARRTWRHGPSRRTWCACPAKRTEWIACGGRTRRNAGSARAGSTTSAERGSPCGIVRRSRPLSLPSAAEYSGAFCNRARACAASCSRLVRWRSGRRFQPARRSGCCVGTACSGSEPRKH